MSERIDDVLAWLDAGGAIEFGPRGGEPVLSLSLPDDSGRFTPERPLKAHQSPKNPSSRVLTLGNGKAIVITPVEHPTDDEATEGAERSET